MFYKEKTPQTHVSIQNVIYTVSLFLSYYFHLQRIDEKNIGSCAIHMFTTSGGNYSFDIIKGKMTWFNYLYHVKIFVHSAR